ncbi:tail fiber protein [Pasteurella multocida subsp. multocida]|uniref:tail fiber protein n=1 Tax=Pasteurella multocida TaxID=747 RepID=UPI002301DE08|nr:tail fiber protein [Pasteurella multocida]MDA5618028.1 tail fiber protein [Pasteurella multocida subsp. multocida]
MADFNKPTVDSHYTQFPNEIKAAINAALSFLDGGTHANIPLKAKRWNPTSKIFEEYSGTQWVPMATEYKLPVDYNVLLNKPVPSSATNSDSETQFASSKAVKDAYDLANEKQSPATTLSGYGITDFVVKDLTAEDLNNVTTPGFYSQRLTARAERNKNYPLTEAGSLVVKPSAYVLMQEYTTHKTKRIYIRNRTDFSGAWSEWKLVTSDGLPVGSIVSFPKNITPAGFLKANGTTFNQATYPDLYAVNGNSNRLPNLTRSDVGMTAYFATDAIPDGWIAFDSIRNTVTQQKYPELYQYLVDKYGSISNVPLAEDRFIRNAGNGLSVGQTQESSFEHYHGVGQIIANNDAAMIIGGWDDKSYRSIVVHGQDTYINITNATGEAEKGNQRPLRTAKENANGEVRPKSIVLKLCIKAKNTFDDVQFWIKAFGVVENAGVLDAGTLAQNLQQADVRIQQLENSSKQNQQNIQQIGQQVSQLQSQLQSNAKTRKIWQGNATAGNGLLTLSESIINRNLVFYLQPSVNSTLNNNDVATLSCYVDSKLSEVQQKRFMYAGYFEGGWRNLKIEIVNDTQIKLIDSSGFYLKAITASN